MKHTTASGFSIHATGRRISTLPLLLARPDINLPCKRRFGLGAEPPVRICNGFRGNLPVVAHVPVFRPWDIDHAIDHSVRDMDSFGTEFPSKGLSHSAQSELHSREGGKPGGPLDGGSGSCEYQGGGMR